MSTYYWVATVAGNWSSSANWSATSGGAGGAGAPGVNDTAVFDRGAVACNVTETTLVKNITMNGWTGTLGGVNQKLTVKSGEFTALTGKLNLNSFPLTIEDSVFTTGPSFLFDVSANADKLAFAGVSSWIASLGGAAGSTLTAFGFSYSGTLTLSHPEGVIPGYVRVHQKLAAALGSHLILGKNVVLALGASVYDFNLAEVSGQGKINFLWGGNLTLSGRILCECVVPLGTTTLSQCHIERLTLSRVGITTVVTQSATSVGTLSIASNTAAVTLKIEDDLNIYGDITRLQVGGITVISATNISFVLCGTQDQNVYFEPGLNWVLDKTAGKVTFSYTPGKLSSRILRDAGQEDPRTATLLDLLIDTGSVMTLTGDIAARSTTVVNTSVTIPTGITLDTYSYTADEDASTNGLGTVRVHQEDWNNMGSYSVANTVYWTESVAPPTPTNLRGISISTTQCKMEWDASSGATSYDIEEEDRYFSFGGPSVYHLGNVTSYTCKQNNAGGVRCRVRAVNASGASAWTALVTAAPIPQTPTNVTASGTSGQTIRLSWTVSNVIEGVEGYKLQRSFNGTDGWVDVKTWSRPGLVDGPFSYDDTGLTPSTLYFYRLAAHNSNMAYSNYATTNATTLADAAGAPTGLAASAVTTTSMTLSWNTVSGATGYRLERSPNGSTGWTSIYSGAALTAPSSSLTAGTMYYYRVFATNTGGDSAASGTLAKATLCIAPTGVTAVAQDRTTDIVVSWPAVTGATSYLTEWSATGSSGWTSVGSGTALTQTNAVGTVNVMRYYRVTAINGSGNSAVSANASTKTAPAAPTGAATSAITQTSITVTWTQPTGATKNKVEASGDGGTTWGEIYLGTASSYVHSGLTSSKNYQYRISSDNL